MKRLALAATAAFGTVSVSATALFFVPVLALTGGGPPTGGLCGLGGDVGAALATIRQLESGNNYTARITTATASGAYAFIDSAWRTWSAAAGYPGLYPSAYLAPPHIQDAAAAAYVHAILDQWHDITYVPVNWYYPAAARNPALMDIVPALQAGNRLTIRQYQTRWLNLYRNKLAGTNPGDVPAGRAPPATLPPSSRSPALSSASPTSSPPPDPTPTTAPGSPSPPTPPSASSSPTSPPTRPNLA